MNVVLNTGETNVVLGLVTSQILDHLDLSPEGKELIRGWRRDHNIGSTRLNDFAVDLNEAVGNFIDDNTRRMIRQRGKIKTLER